MTIQTILHAYNFDTLTPEGAAAWQEFKAERIASGARIMGPVWHDGREDLSFDGATITLEPGADNVNLFDDQWNASAPGGQGFRAFDWLLHAEKSHPSQSFGAPRGTKRGYWLVLTDEMQRLRAETLTCGYCGHKHPIAAAPEFCPACIGSEYLTPEHFPLTRLAPVAAGRDKSARPDLSEAEAAERLAAWTEAQREGAKTRAGAKLTKFRASVEAKTAKAKASAEAERAGMLWLLDHDLGSLACDNVIYYSHTGRFGIGWRTKLQGSLAHEIMGQLSDGGFPFPYDVETVDLGRLSSD